jgi:glycosyltransferase involved in cell wall biosynthesis
MKVALLTSYIALDRAGGIGIAVAALSRALRSVAAVDCRIFGLLAPEDRPLPPEPDVSAYRVAGPRAFGYAPALAPALDAAGLDLVHTHGLWNFPSLAACRWGRRTGRPWIVSPHGMLDAWALRRSTGKKRVARILFEDANLHGAACLHAVNEAEALAMRAFGLRNPIAIVPNMADLPPPTLPPAPAWKQALQPGTRVILFLGRLHPKKGLSELIDGWSRLPAASRDRWHLAIAGWDEVGMQNALESQARSLGVSASVRFIGPQFGDTKAVTLAHADAFILPSHSEGMPVAVLEAWAHALPVVMTRACNLPIGFAAGAALATAPDPATIADTLAALITLNERQRRSMGEAGRQLVHDRYSRQRVAAAMSQVYRWLLGAAVRPGWVDQH